MGGSCSPPLRLAGGERPGGERPGVEVAGSGAPPPVGTRTDRVAHDPLRGGHSQIHYTSNLQGQLAHSV